MTDLQKKKLQSRRFLIVAWACGLITLWGSASMIFAIVPVWMTSALTLLIAIPTSYITITSIKKKKEL